MFGMGLRSIGLEEPGIGERSEEEPGVIMIGGGLAHGTLEPEESLTVHLELGSIFVFVRLFGIKDEKGPVCEFLLMGDIGLLFGTTGIIDEASEFGPRGDNGPVCEKGIFGSDCTGLTGRTSFGFTAPTVRAIPVQ